MDPNKKTQEELLAEIEALKASEKRKGDELAAANAIIEKSAKSGKPVSSPVPGTFKAEYEDPEEDKTIKKTVKFKDGATFTRLPSGAVVKSALLIKLAEGKDLTEEEAKENEQLAKLGKVGAKKVMTNLVAIGYGLLEEVKK